MSTLLIELGCEELPAQSVMPLAEQLRNGVCAALAEAGLLDAAATEASPGRGVRVYGTPRRIACTLDAVKDRQPDRQVERRGPAVDKAWQDGVVGGTPTKALEGFVRSAGATLADLGTLETDKGAWVVLRLDERGRTLGEILADALPGIVRGLPMPRRMRWGDGDDEFLRPVAWLVALHGADVLPVSLLGLEAGRETRGHRQHAPGPHALADADDYLTTLERARVLADASVRRQRVLEGVTREAAQLGGTAVADEALLDEVTQLVEWPVALAGRFEERFLEIPKEALIQTMQDNQRYFALLDDDGALMPAFVTVANLESSRPETVVDGNERVIRPRFEDTMFFWQQDLGTPLRERREALDRVLFETTLGSVGDKVTRLERLVAALAPRLGASVDEVLEAASLSKGDLVSGLVEELPKMQGIAGHHYALRDGVAPNVARAIEQHYWPVRSGAPLPEDAIGRTLALADRLDTLVGIFGVGRKPSGTKDPYALRRASIGIVRLLAESTGDAASSGDAVALDELVSMTRAVHGELPAFDAAEVVDFLRDRLRAWLTGERGEAVDVVDAVLRDAPLDPADLLLRVEATRRFRRTEAAASLAAASKRVGNILRKSDGAGELPGIDPNLFVDDAERQLGESLSAVGPRVRTALDGRDYAAALAATATLAAPVDRYFEDVLVNAEDESLRRNRLATLARLDGLCRAVIDLAALQPVSPTGNGDDAGSGTA